jgi:hypothetical protein
MWQTSKVLKNKDLIGQFATLLCQPVRKRRFLTFGNAESQIAAKPSGSLTI